ncbi:hypothetical protein FNV43_RR19525 [Rhamnella rubrinervis]|uniref:Ataxin-2 C-terminal domain-containing protein n=1 Tax=Rhamnella rubrinervis TaxID=2594499 RepID=A0A8K0DSU2_9ROSA|nr:hypothetical protein FNV43_RR19525 [Rhamnella rubrinervis]
MALVAGGRSSLNANAPLYVPAVLRQVEDFSPEWWALVKTSPWFCDYWLNQHEEDDFDGSADAVRVAADMVPETFDLDSEEEFAYLEAELEDLALSSEAEGKTELADSADKNERKPFNGLNMAARSILKNLIIPKPPRDRSPKSPRGPAKYRQKPVQCQGWNFYHLVVLVALRLGLKI